MSLDQLLTIATDPILLISATAGLAVFALAFGLSSLASAQQARLSRIRGAAGRTRRSGQGREIAHGDDVMAVIRRLVHRLNVMRDQRGEAVAQKLARAGWRSRDAQALYLFGKLALPFVLVLVAVAALFVVGDQGLSLTVRLAIVAGAGLLGSRLPELIVKNRTERRNKAMQKALPDALDLMVICAEAGLSLDASINRVAKEVAPTSGDLADEFGLTLLELRFMPERRRALENLAKRVDLKAIQALVNTLFQTEKFGTPLAQALRVLAHELRTERMLRAEEKAARLPATMTVPLILFILPALFVVLLGPAILDLGEVLTKF
jgi:tight adherence protein C